MQHWDIVQQLEANKSQGFRFVMDFNINLLILIASQIRIKDKVMHAKICDNLLSIPFGPKSRYELQNCKIKSRFY